jgi:hypothetical protein
MSRTQNLRWKRKAVALAAVAVSFGGYAALGSSTVSASNYGEWDCSGSQSIAVDDQSCTVPTDDYTSDTVVDSVPVDSVPVDSVPVDTTPVDTTPVTDPTTTQPTTTQPTAVQPTGEQLPPAPTTKPTTPAVVAPAAVTPQVAPAHVLPVTGRGSALPTIFIAIGLLGAGSVALAFARRSQAARSNES